MQFLKLFIRAENWPSSNPYLNPLDYGLWSVLESTACSKRHDNLESLFFFFFLQGEIRLRTISRAEGENRGRCVGFARSGWH